MRAATARAAFLTMIGQATSASRPDLIGLSLPSMDITIAVEAKGRTGSRDAEVVLKAKEQARSLPGVLSTSSALRVASVASFSQGQWESYLEDPAGPVQPLNSLIAGALLAAYYRPLVAAQLEAGNDQVTQDDAMTFASLPGLDVVFGIPTAIVTIMRTPQLLGQVTASQLDTAGSALLESVRDPQGEARGRTTAPDEADSADFLDQPAPYTGLDGIYIEPGPSWLRTPR